MCLIATYSELEKKSQICKVQKMMDNGKFRSERELKDFLYNLSFMNNMVVKGYMKERTEQDFYIYQTKNDALEWIVAHYPERCSVCFRNRVLYVYSSSRQYSYHFRSYDSSWFSLRQANDNEWNGIAEGFMMSDCEYKARTSGRHHNHKVIDWKNELGECGVYGYLKKMYALNLNDTTHLDMYNRMRKLFHSGNIVYTYMECANMYDNRTDRFTFDANVIGRMMEYVISWRQQEVYNEQRIRMNAYMSERSKKFMDDLTKVAQKHKNIMKTKGWQKCVSEYDRFGYCNYTYRLVQEMFDRYAEKYGINDGATYFRAYCMDGFGERMVNSGCEYENPMNYVGGLAYRFYHILKNKVTYNDLNYVNR